ncbi:hypothetical protein FOL47_000209, partial [Perkinsus chesapeaki]
NLARPLDLSTASLSWNIAGCQVIPCPTKSGYIWVVKGGQLKESLYFSAPTLDFANDWIQAMDRASRRGEAPRLKTVNSSSSSSALEEMAAQSNAGSVEGSGKFWGLCVDLDGNVSESFASTEEEEI